MNGLIKCGCGEILSPFYFFMSGDFICHNCKKDFTFDGTNTEQSQHLTTVALLVIIALEKGYKKNRKTIPEKDLKLMDEKMKKIMDLKSKLKILESTLLSLEILEMLKKHGESFEEAFKKHCM